MSQKSQKIYEPILKSNTFATMLKSQTFFLFRKTKHSHFRNPLIEGKIYHRSAIYDTWITDTYRVLMVA